MLTNIFNIIYNNYMFIVQFWLKLKPMNTSMAFKLSIIYTLAYTCNFYFMASNNCCYKIVVAL